MELAGPLHEDFVTLQEQVSPAPWMLLNSLVDIQKAVDEYRSHHPGATVDEVVRDLHESGLEVNGALVAQQMLHRPRFREVSAR